MKELLRVALTESPVEMSLENNVELSLEDIDNAYSLINSANLSLEESDRLELAMDEASEISLTLESLIDSGNNNPVIANLLRNKIISLESEFGFESKSCTLEDNNDDIIRFNEMSLEAISGFWNRIKQLEVSKWQGLFDGLQTLFAGYKSFGTSQQKRVHKLRQEWDSKKKTLRSNSHKASMVGETIYPMFLVDGNLSNSPHEDMVTDYKYAKFLIEEYPKVLSSYIDDVRKTIESGDYSSDTGFEKSVLGKLAKMNHPSELITLDIVGKGNKLLGNKGLELKEGSLVKPVSNGADYKKLADLTVNTHVHEFIFSWKMLNAHILEDYYLSTEDVDGLLDYVEKYAGLLIHGVDTFKPLLKSIKEMTKIQKKSIDTDSLNKENKEAFKQAIKFMGGLTKYTKTPYRVEMTRIQGLVHAARVITSRTIATAE